MSKNLTEAAALSAAEKLQTGQRLSKTEFVDLLCGRTPELAESLAEKARRVREQYFGRDVYVRGLVEITNICKNNCLYCGIRAANTNVSRYRLSDKDILASCEAGHALGFRTFVLQGGEDPAFTPERVENLVGTIRDKWPDSAITLSLGEHPREVFARWKTAGADRYLLRHETANAEHYQKLHPAEMSFDNRMRCLRDLKVLGYQVGCGMMVGSPFQTPEDLADDLVFLQEFRPHMVGIGPFIPATGTPFAGETAGTLEDTLFLLSVIRLLLPKVLLPATTALGTIDPKGREKGILCGANVIMPNLSPETVRGKYSIYDNKLSVSADSAILQGDLAARMRAIGYKIVVARGDSPEVGE